MAVTKKVVKETHLKLKLGFELYPLQQEIYDHVVGDKVNPETGLPYRFFTLCFGRQSGKSFFCKKLALDRAINHREKVMWVAPAISTAQIHWDDISDLLDRAMEGGFRVKSINQSRKQVKFYGGGQITIRSAIKPERLRGPSPNLIILDEVAFFPNGNDTFTKVIQPMVSATRGKIVLASTPNGRNWFYDIFNKGVDGKSKYYRSWRSTSMDSPYQDKELLEEFRRSLSSKQWREEYLAEFLADSGGVFAGVEEAATSKMLFSPLRQYTYVMGVDIGFVNDETAVSVICVETREQVYGESWTNIGTLETLKRLGELFDIWQPTTTMFEKNGLGETFFDLIKLVFTGKEPDRELLATIYDRPEQTVMSEEEAEDRYDGYYGTPDNRKPRDTKEIRVEGMTIKGVHMNNDLKRGAVEGLSADIEYGRLKILTMDTPYGKKQVNQMSTYQRKPTATGMTVTYNAQEGEHDDLVAALYLARKALPKPIRPQREKSSIKDTGINPFKGSSKQSRPWYKR